MWSLSALLIISYSTLIFSSKISIDGNECQGFKCQKNASSVYLDSINSTEYIILRDDPYQHLINDSDDDVDDTLLENNIDLTSVIKDDECNEFPPKNFNCCIKHPEIKWCQMRSLDVGPSDTYDQNNNEVFPPNPYPVNNRKPFTKSLLTKYPDEDNLVISSHKNYKTVEPSVDSDVHNFAPLSLYYEPPQKSTFSKLINKPQLPNIKPPKYNPNPKSPNVPYKTKMPSDTTEGYKNTPSNTREYCEKVGNDDPYCCMDYPDLQQCGNNYRIPKEDNCKCVPKGQCQLDISKLARQLNPTYPYCENPNYVCCNKEYSTSLPSTSPTECGRVSTIISNSRSASNFARIVNQDYAIFGEFPWMGALLYTNYTYVCGAALIDSRWAVTAAHCLTYSSNNKYVVRFGKRNLNDESEPPFQEPNVMQIVMHADYNPRSLVNDIALLKLDPPITYNDYIRPICLPSDVDFSSYECRVSGWGRDTINGSYSEILKKVYVPLVAHDTCEMMYKNSILGDTFNLHSRFLCAGERLKDACKGDGGSPLECKIDDVHYLVGIVSWGIGCGNDYPGVYTKIPSFVNWISSNIKE